MSCLKGNISSSATLALITAIPWILQTRNPQDITKASYTGGMVEIKREVL